MIYKIPKEICQPCKKFISIGQPILECEKCLTAIHTHCYKAGGFASINNNWLCHSCVGTTIPRYNPFAYINSVQHDSNKFHENDSEGIDTILQSVTSILETCHPYDSTELSELTSRLKNCESSAVSAMFLNIDGNTSNFNTLLVELKRLRHSFPIIRIIIKIEITLNYTIAPYKNILYSICKSVETMSVKIYVCKTLPNKCLKN